MKRKKGEVPNPAMLPRPRKTFMEVLAGKLQESNLFDFVEMDAFGDKSASWINAKKGKHSLTFQFNMKGDKLGRVGIWEDVVKVVEADPIHIFNQPEKTAQPR